MIEIICDKNENGTNESYRKEMIRKPKNIKQIGELDSDKKIYIEDYAFTYINSIAYSNQDEEHIGVLLGESQKTENEKYIFIKGVVKAKITDSLSKNGTYFDEKVWNKIYSDVEKFFPRLTIVGWFISVPKMTSERMFRIKKTHLDNFAGNMKTLFQINVSQREENFFLYENSELRKQAGYICFYERNYEMQEYMMQKREGKSSEEGYDDRVIKNIRKVIKEKEVIKEQKRNNRLIYGFSGILVVVILVIGINLMNNYEKMTEFDHSINNLMNQMSSTNNIEETSYAIPVNVLPGDVYPTTSQNTSISQNITNSIQNLTTNAQASLTDMQNNLNDIQTTQAAQIMQEMQTTLITQMGNEIAKEGNISLQETSNLQTEPTETVQVSEPYIYTVKKGDTIMSICNSHYGTTSKYTEVMAANDITDSTKLMIGQQIKLP